MRNGFDGNLAKNEVHAAEGLGGGDGLRDPGLDYGRRWIFDFEVGDSMPGAGLILGIAPLDANAQPG